MRLDGTVVGDVSYEAKSPERACIDGLNILPEYRGRGYGKLALEWLLGVLGGCRRIELSVHPHNRWALIIYLQLGFKIESWADNHYGDGQPRLILAREASCDSARSSSAPRPK